MEQSASVRTTRAAADAVADHGLDGAVPDGARRGVRLQRPLGGWVSIAAGLMLLIYMDGALVRRRDPRVRGRKYGGWEDLSFRWG